MIGVLVLVLAQGWQPCAPMPTPGYGFACAAVGSRVYAIGGLISEADSPVPRLAVEAFDPAADSWIAGLPYAPGPRWYAGCAELNGKIYLIGGTPDGHSDLSRVDRFDPSTNVWDTVASLPWPRSALAACEYGGCVYAIGGFMGGGPGTYERTVARFTPDSGPGRWDVVESLVTPRTSLAAATAGDRMCAVGGRFFNDLATFESYQPGAGWRQSNRLMHYARSSAAAVGWDKWLCAIGGQGRYGPTSSVELVNVDGGSWQDAAGLSVPRVFCGAAVAGGFVVVMGGRAPHGADASVERSDSTLFPSGIAEAQAGTPAQALPSWATLVSGRVRITCRSAVVYDASGHRVFAGPGPVDAAFASGVYFARVVDADGRMMTGRVTVAARGTNRR